MSAHRRLESARRGQHQESPIADFPHSSADIEGAEIDMDLDEEKRMVPGGRVDVDEALPSVEIPRRILNELYAHALEILPEECCGLIVGDQRERFKYLVRCRNEMTVRHREDPNIFPRDGKEAFYMNALDYMRATEKAETEGDRVTTMYHSHVGVGAYLSEMDREYAESEFFPFPDADHIVVSVLEFKVDSVAFFRLDREGRVFTGRTVVSMTDDADRV